MAGAAARIRRERGLAWEAALLPYRKKVPGYDEFTGERRNPDPPGFLDMRLRASVKGIKAVRLEDVLASRRI